MLAIALSPVLRFSTLHCSITSRACKLKIIFSYDGDHLFVAISYLFGNWLFEPPSWLAVYHVSIRINGWTLAEHEYKAKLWGPAPKWSEQDRILDKYKKEWFNSDWFLLAPFVLFPFHIKGV